MITVSIVIYNNTLSEIEECVKHFVDCENIRRIVICDNYDSSKIDSAEVLAISSKLIYVSNPCNTGYGAGHNLAISHLDIKSEFHVVMNLDVTAEQAVFTNILDYMYSDKKVVHVMPKVLNSDGTVQRLCKMLPTPINLIGRRFIRNRGFAKNIDRKYTLDTYDYDKVLECPYLSGCFMFLRRSAFEQVSGFDERFFMYPEDIDLTRRLHEVGKTVCYPFVSIVHEHGQASYKSRRMLHIHIRGIVKYFNKWGWFFDRKRSVYNSRLEGVLKK